jgi:glycosyltransferase involved in cell wall biosynthesis
MAIVCLVTPGQPSTNPRLVKEADALAEAGHTVHVVCAHWAAWADDADRVFLAARRFRCTYVGGRQKGKSLRYLWTRVRHRLGRESLRLPVALQAPIWALCRVSPELRKAARRVKADLYVAHNLGALPAAWAAARRHNAKCGFDAEDFHSGTSPHSGGTSRDALLAEQFEERILPECDYVSAASPLIANQYATKYSIETPATILNVFSKSERPPFFRASERDEPLRLCWFSQTIGAGRGIEDVIRAMGLLKAYEVELHLLGQWQAGYKSQLDRLLESLALRASCVRKHDPLLPNEVVGWSAKYDVGVAGEPLDSLNARFCLSNKIFTYMLAGNAIVASATPAQKRLIEEGRGVGCCYEPGDVTRLAEHLQRWCVDRGALNIARRRAWDLGDQKFNWDLEKVNFVQLVEKVLSLRREEVA